MNGELMENEDERQKAAEGLPMLYTLRGVHTIVNDKPSGKSKVRYKI